MAITRTAAQDFFDTHLAPNHATWLASPLDLRLAMNAILSLYHMADHFWHSFSQSDPNRIFQTPNSSLFRTEMAKRYNHFAILRDIAEAHKHMRLDRPTKTLTESKQTGVGTTGWGEGDFGTGPYGGVPSIVVQLDDNSKHHLIFLSQEVRQLWLSMLNH